LLEGRCTVERGTGLLAKAVGTMIGFPQPALEVDVSVRFENDRGVEKWTRTFGGRSFSSLQFEGSGKFERLLCEQFGPLRFALALVFDGVRLSLVLRGWSAFGLSLPLRWGPWTNSFETVEDDRFRFDVEIGHQLIGLIVRYQGWLRTAAHLPVGESGMPGSLTAAASAPLVRTRPAAPKRM